MKTLSITTVAAALMLLVACGRDNESRRLEITTQPLQGATHSKVAINGTQSHWRGGEQLILNGDLVNVVVEGDRAYIDNVASAAQYRALYPTMLTQTTVLPNSKTITLPAQYHYAANAGLQQLETPLAANIASGPLVMQHLTGALCINISNNSATRTMTVDYITVQSDRYLLSGQTEVNFAQLNNIQPVVAATDADRQVTMIMDRQRLDIAAGATATVLLPVAAVGDDNHFTVTVSARERGARYTYSKTQNAGGALAAGQVGYVPVAISNEAGDQIAKTNLFSGTGTEADPYLIGTPQEFALFAEAVTQSETITNVGITGSRPYTTAHYSITANIDMSRLPLVPIEGFGGNLNGNNHTVSNLRVNGLNSVGLFFSLNSNTTVRDLTLDSLTISGTSARPTAGGLAAATGGITTISNCHITRLKFELPNLRSYKCGGLIGSIGGETTITNCSVQADLELSSSECDGYFGGIVGTVANSKNLSLSYCTAIVSGTLVNCPQTGGIIGSISSMNNLIETAAIHINNCTWSGDFTLSANNAAVVAGGIVGRSDRSTALDGCSAEGSIAITSKHSGNRAGALIGYKALTATYTSCTANVALTATGGTTGNPDTH